MNLITDPLRELVQRKLWPVALLLVAALVAVPMLLAKEPEAAGLAPLSNAASGDGMPATFVSAVEVSEDGTRRRVLGAKKDPFEPAPLKKTKKPTVKTVKKAEAASKHTTTATGEKPGPASGGGGGSSTPPATVPPVSAAPAPKTTYPAYSIRVRFGTTDGELATGTFERMSVLPDDEKPVLVYRGVEDGGKVAVFELTGAVVADGDGKCAPTPEDCQYLKLRAGETEFITVTETGTETDAQYQLDLVKIYRKQTTAKSEALTKASSSKLKSMKRVKLRKRNRYVFDETTGTLHRAHGKTPRGSL